MKIMRNPQYYEYIHSAPDGNGVEYISFHIRKPQIDEHGLLNGEGIYIRIDNKRQRTDVYSDTWVGGAPKGHQHLLTLKDEIITDVEVPALMRRIGIEVDEKEAENHERSRKSGTRTGRGRIGIGKPPVSAVPQPA